jgi:hypothetical protein
MPLGFPPEALSSALAYTPRAGDVFVASYPKSGTTWLQYIIYLLLEQRALAPGETLTAVFPHIEEVGAEVVVAMPAPRLIKTHLAFPLTPFSEAARYLVIARNPFDCAVSFFHHTCGFPQHYDFAGGIFADFFECFLAGEVDFCGYFDHLLSWQSEASRSNVLWLTYEALRSSTDRLIRSIAAFLGSHAESLVASDAGLAWVLRESGIESMRRAQQRWSSARPDWAAPFVRRGVVGDWRSAFTPAMTRALLAEFDRRVSGTACASLWPDIMSAARRFAHGDRDPGA